MNNLRNTNLGLLSVVFALLGLGYVHKVDAETHTSSEAKYDRNEIWVTHTHETRATCEIYVDGELVAREKGVSKRLPWIYKHSAPLNHADSFKGVCDAPANVAIKGKAADYSKEAASATSDMNREQWLISQGSTRSNKFSVHESARNPGSRMSQQEKAQAMQRAEKRYQEAQKSGGIAESESLAGDEYKSELEALLGSLEK